MFWDSVVAGFGVLGHAKIWIGIILLVVANVGFLVMSTSIFGRGESGGRMAAGCLLTGLGAPLFHGFAMSVFVGFYLPMMLGSDEIMSSAWVMSALWPLAKAGVLAVIVVFVLCIVPVLGDFISNSPGTQTFLVGVIIFRLATGPVLAEASSKYSISSSVFPSLWSSIGYLVIAGLLVRVLLFGGAFLSAVPKKREVTDLVGAILMALAPSFGILGGLLPLFMYAQHVRLVLISASR